MLDALGGKPMVAARMRSIALSTPCSTKVAASWGCKASSPRVDLAECFGRGLEPGTINPSHQIRARRWWDQRRFRPWLRSAVWIPQSLGVLRGIFAEVRRLAG